MMQQDYMLVYSVSYGWRIVPYNAFNRTQYGTNCFIGDYEECLRQYKKKNNEKTT